MSKWLVTLQHDKKTGDDGYDSVGTVYLHTSNNIYVEFEGDLPTEKELRTLKEKHKFPVITFMQKLGG